MKFLCVECDESMELSGAEGPFDGSMSVLFACRSCGRKIAMLTNPMETQMVHSLGVKVGGRKEAAPAMETIRTSLRNRVDGGDGGPTTAPLDPNPSTDPQTETSSDDSGESTGGSCPFSAMVTGSMGGDSAAAHGPVPGMESENPDSRNADDFTWTPGARERMDRIPEFLRPMIQRGIEEYARGKGIDTIDEDVMAEVRGGMGM